MNYGPTLSLPKTDFPLRANAKETEALLLERWKKLDLYKKLRENREGCDRFVLHDGPPYANGNIHLGHALNKILKDIAVRSHQMYGREVDFRPGWDCHGLPIEWAVEKEYRAEGRQKDDVPVNEFRARCREFATYWQKIQSAQFQALGICADWDNPYLTMSFDAEAQIAAEIMKFASNGLLYRGSKPVLWSYAEKTALAEAEVEHANITSDAIYVTYRVSGQSVPSDMRFLAFTTTPWTIPASRALSYSPRISYGLYLVSEASEDNWAPMGAYYIVADKLVASVEKALRVTLERTGDMEHWRLSQLYAHHPLRDIDPVTFDFKIPLFEGSHVTDDLGTGFVHTAPSHGREDYDVWMAHSPRLQAMGVLDASIPHTVDEAGMLTAAASPAYKGLTVFDEDGKTGTANPRIIDDLLKAKTLVARSRLKHQYPHSWRSKKPLIFRNTPQWFISLDAKALPDLDSGKKISLRQLALAEIQLVEWHPLSGQNRIRGMIETRPDWLVSRQRSWGVPLAIFAKADGTILVDQTVNDRITAAFRSEGADAWFADGARERFLGDRAGDDWIKVDDVLDVWFDSGSTHAFVLDERRDGDRVMYLEGSDQHRGWFQSSLLEACGTKGSAPFDVVATYGFVLYDKVQKMSKTLGNVVSPETIVDEANTDVLRLWVAASDTTDDIWIDKSVIQTFANTYKKMRNTLRWMLGMSTHYHDGRLQDLEELEEYAIQTFGRLVGLVIDDYLDGNYKRVVSRLTHYMNTELSAFYFDVRKDALYCDPPSSKRRRGALTVIRKIFYGLVELIAPIMPFLAEEAYLCRGNSNTDSVHLGNFSQPFRFNDDPQLEQKWTKIRMVRDKVLAALEISRGIKQIGSPLEAAVVVHIDDQELFDIIESVEFGDLCIVSKMTVLKEDGPSDPDYPDGIAIGISRAPGRKCARSWRYSTDVGSDPDYPDVSARDAQALRELGIKIEPDDVALSPM